jgi:hypothetical protein
MMNLGSLSLSGNEWKQKQKKDNELGSLLSHVATHEENKLEINNAPSGLSSSSNLLLHCPKP